jgi:hypothetical protein
MLQPLPDLPPGVIGYEVVGKLESADYRDILLPAIEHAASVDDIRIVIEISELSGMSGGAVWEDMKMGVEHWRAWKRIAVVTDIDWMTHAVQWFGWMTPGDVKHFALVDRAAALAWVAE